MKYKLASIFYKLACSCIEYLVSPNEMERSKSPQLTMHEDNSKQTWTCHQKIKFVSQLSFHLEVIANIWKKTDINCFLHILYHFVQIQLIIAQAVNLKCEHIEVVPLKLNIFLP